jgi:hypothetical protein
MKKRKSAADQRDPLQEATQVRSKVPGSLVEILAPIWVGEIANDEMKKQIIETISGETFSSLESPKFLLFPKEIVNIGSRVEIKPVIYFNSIPVFSLPASAMWKWGSSGFYLQIGYMEASKNVSEEEVVALLRTMTVFDLGYCETGAIPKILYTEIAQQEGSATEGIPILNMNLVQRRNELLVMNYAMLQGRDPGSAYDNFLAAGGKYFLDYPVLCP